MKIYKKALAIILSVLLVLFTPCVSIAGDLPEDINNYEEFHDQINFDDLLVFVVNKDDIVVEVDPTVSILKKAKAIKQKEKYEKYVQNHTTAEKDLLDAVNSSEYICAISYTDIPLVYADGHYERVIKENELNSSLFGVTVSATEKESEPTLRHRLTLKTSIKRSGSSNPYTYTAKTIGEWDNSVSLIGGEKKPAAGNDFVMQSCPTVTATTSFKSTYNYETSGSKKGQEGINYFLTDGGDSWAQYEVVDDPVGNAQLKTFELTQTFKAKTTEKTKKINSYYIHTWKTITLSVTVSGNAGTSGGKPTAGVELSITPSREDKQWKAYNPVSFDW